MNGFIIIKKQISFKLSDVTDAQFIDNRPFLLSII